MINILIAIVITLLIGGLLRYTYTLETRIMRLEARLGDNE